MDLRGEQMSRVLTFVACLLTPAMAGAQQPLQYNVPYSCQDGYTRVITRCEKNARGGEVCFFREEQNGQLITERYMVRGQMDGWLAMCKAPAAQPAAAPRPATQAVAPPQAPVGRPGQPLNPPYLAGMPSPEAIRQKIQGSTPLDTLARQVTVLNRLTRIIERMRMAPERGFCLDMLTIALELAQDNPVYEDLACKFFEHFIYIAGAMDRVGINNDELWDEEDGFYYDVLRLPRGEAMRVKVRSMVGLIPLYASAVFSSDILERLPRFKQRVEHFVQENASFLTNISNPLERGVATRILLSPLNRQKLTRLLRRMLDPAEFLSPYGIRALSGHHKDHPYEFAVGGTAYRVDYEPAESSTGLFGGNSNWRGPIWMPVNLLLIQSLRKMYCYYGDELRIECPTGSGRQMTLWEIANEIAGRLGKIFLRDEEGRRPVYGGTERFQTDPNWRDVILFYEYFHGDNGAGMGASHQTGWTGIVTWLMISVAILNPKEVLEKGYDAVALKVN
jgi:hypothetical protein